MNKSVVAIKRVLNIFTYGQNMFIVHAIILISIPLFHNEVWLTNNMLPIGQL